MRANIILLPPIIWEGIKGEKAKNLSIENFGLSPLQLLVPPEPGERYLAGRRILAWVIDARRYFS